MAGPHIKDPSSALAPYLASDSGLVPKDITDLGLYREYEEKRRQGLWEKAAGILTGDAHGGPLTPPMRPVQAEKSVAGYIALAVPEEIQDKLRGVVDPVYSTFKGEHVTLKLGAKQPSDESTRAIKEFSVSNVEVYGVADDGFALQCLLVRVNGLEINPINGVPYHVTWSLNSEAEVPGAYNKNGKPSMAKPMHSGYVAAQEKFITRWPPANIIPLNLSPQFYPQATATPNAAAVPRLNH